MVTRRAALGWFRYRTSLAWRVALITTISVGLVVSVFAIACYVAVRAKVQSSADESLVQRAHVAARSYVDPAGQLLIPDWVIGAGDVRVGVLSADGRFWRPDMDKTTYPDLGEPEKLVAEGRSDTSLRTISANGSDFRIAAVPLDDGIALVVAESLDAQQAVLNKLSALMLLLGLLGVITAGLAGWAAANGGLRPVRRLTDDVERIARTENLTPIPVDGDDEVTRLARSFNGLLATLSTSRDRQKQLVADAGHELRTPLTSIRTNIDLLRQADLSLDAGQRRELLDDVNAQMEEMTTLIGDLVELARDEGSAPTLAPVSVPDVVERAVTRVRRRAPSLDWDVSMDQWWVVGEAGSIERAVTNLLDNAAKWSPNEATVHVMLRAGELTIDDEGPGISESDRPHVFDRFYRAPESRAMPGSGLGLAIVRQAVERHGGTIEVSPSPRGGARFVLRLPGASNKAPDSAPAVARR